MKRLKYPAVIKGISVLLALVVMLGSGLVPSTVEASAGAARSDSSPNMRTMLAKKPTVAASEVRGIWVSYLEMQTLLQKKTEAQFTQNIIVAFDNIASMGLNTIYVQVRPFGDALYDSAYFPWSHTITGTEGKNPGFDPLAIMVKEAHARNLLIEAWVNPYRIRPHKDGNKALSTDNPASAWIKSKDRAVVRYGKLTSYNPANAKAQELIVNGVKEIVENYAVDGIHIDDYFYPTTGLKNDATFDKPEYDAYKKQGGTLAFASWRRRNVETLIQKMYAGVKAVNPKATFGISPQSNITTNFSHQYLDIAKITATTGYCDYIAPQIYFGFNNEVQPFAETIAKWEKMVEGSGIDLYIGIASYKVGTKDSYAGKGSKEWMNTTDLSARMITHARDTGGYAGFILYRYDHIFTPASGVAKQVKAENKNIEKLIK